jgi:acyl carrier protein
MPMISTQDVVPIVRSFLATGKESRPISESDQLSELGIDSLTTLNVMLTAAERFGLDLGQLDENMRVPATIGDIVAVLTELRA